MWVVVDHVHRDHDLKFCLLRVAFFQQFLRAQNEGPSSRKPYIVGGARLRWERGAHARSMELGEGCGPSLTLRERLVVACSKERIGQHAVSLRSAAKNRCHCC